jgi:hypothetical protein
MHAEPRLSTATAVGLALFGVVAGVGFGVVQQHRTIARLEARHREERAEVGARIDELRRLVEAVRGEVGEARAAGDREHRRLGGLVHELDQRLEELRSLAEPMVAEAPEAQVVAQ